MAKFIRNSNYDRIEISIRKTNNDRNSDINRNVKLRTSRNFIKDLVGKVWAKVIFTKGVQFDPEWIRQELQKAANYHNDRVFQIYNYRSTSESAIVFVELKDMSLDVFKTNCRKIPDPFSGQPCDVVVLSIDCPETPVTLPDKWIDALKHVLDMRYNNSEKSLNLSNFSEDNFLLGQGLWMSLTRPVIVKAISTLLQTIQGFSLNSLDLSNNDLAHVFHLVVLLQAVPIRSLNISGNALIYKSFLRLLQSASFLISLTVLDDTGLTGQKTKYYKSFVSELREYCPSLQMLNGESVINVNDSYGGQRSTQLPPTIRTIGGELEELVLNFFREHSQKIELDHDGLLSYYSSDSVLTISACYHDLVTNQRRLAEAYLKNCRNLARLKDDVRRTQLIKRGSAQILGFYSEIPRLKHIVNSFVLDVIVNNDQSKMFSVSGVFVECIRVTNKSNNHRISVDQDGSGVDFHHVFNMRLFSRTFIVVPPGKILQENWTITNPTDGLFRKHRASFEDIRQQFDAEKTESQRVITTTKPIITNAEQLDHESLAAANQQRAAIIQHFCQFSGMNQSFSVQCLQETGWIVDQAKEVFRVALSSGKIPPEAFQK